MSDYGAQPNSCLRAMAEHHLGSALTADTGIVLHGRDGRIVSWNAAAESILGLSSDQMNGRTSADPRWAVIDASGLFVPAERRPVMQVLRTGRPVRGYVAGVHRPTVDATAEHVWISGSSHPIFDADDTSPTWVITAFTVLGGVEGELLRLTESERRYRWIAHNANDMVAVLAPDTTHLWVSPSCLSLTGYTADDMVGRTMWEFVHPSDIPAVRAAVDAMHPGDSDRLELTYRWRRADGRLLWVESVGHSTSAADSDSALIRVSTRDVTARVAAETERDTALSQLELLVDAAPIGMCAVDDGGVIVRANEALSRWTGYPAAQLVGIHFTDLTHPDESASTAADLSAVAAGTLPTASVERRFVRSDGETIWAERTITQVAGGEARGPLYIVQLLDLTDVRAHTVLAALATTDALTGLPNRVVLNDRLAHALTVARRTRTKVGVIYCDLDRFKQVNDTMGHEAGDDLLRVVADRIRTTVRESDTAVRLGGDEFVVLCENVRDDEPVRRLASRLQAALDQPYELAAGAGDVSVSIGIAVGDGPSATELLQRADESMYRAKRAARVGTDVEEAGEG